MNYPETVGTRVVKAFGMENKGLIGTIVESRISEVSGMGMVVVHYDAGYSSPELPESLVKLVGM